MKCPCPKASDTRVVDSRENGDGRTIRRRRVCGECGKRFTTFERFELRMPQIVKGSGTREEFSEEKLRTGFARALHKRKVPAREVDAAVERVTHRLLSSNEREIEARRIGEAVMQELKRLDKVAYIRFASVYRDFRDVDDFRSAIDEVQPPKRRRGA